MEVDTVVCGDCLKVMANLPDGCMDAIITDPPYGITACEWDVIIPFIPMWEEVRRIIKPRGAIVLFGSQPFTSQLIMSNLEWFKYSLIWEKTIGSGFINAKNRPIAIHEDICVFSSGTIANCSSNRMTYNPQDLIYAPYHKKRSKPMTAKPGGFLGSRPSHVAEYDVKYVNYPKSILRVSNPNNNNVHATQKPVALLEYLIHTYTNKGDTVMDFAIGSGTTAVAALKLGRHFYGCDINQDYVDLANARIEKTRLELSQMELAL